MVPRPDPSRPDPDDPEALAEDPFAGGSRGGYRVGARIASQDQRRRPGWRQIGMAVVVIGALALAALGPRPGETPLTVAVLPTTPPGPTPSGGIATALPSYAAFGSTGVLGLPFPVYAGGLRWVDPRTGRIAGDPFSAPRGWIFPGRGGSAICACLDSPWTAMAAVEAIRVTSFDLHGTVLGARRAAEIASTYTSAGSIVRDVAFSPSHVPAGVLRPHVWARLYVGSAVRTPPGWAVGLRSVSVDASDDRSDRTLDLGTIDDPGGTLAIVPVVRVTPDGRTVRLTLRWRARGAPTGTLWTERAWTVSTGVPSGEETRETPPAVVAVSGPAMSDVPDRCDGEGWATDLDYVELCRREAGDSSVAVVRLVERSGAVREVALGDPAPSDAPSWLVDTTDGIVYRWSWMTHIVSRFDVRGGVVTSRDLGDDADALARATPEAPAVPGTGDVTWSSLISADDQGSLRRLAGSADGSRLFAIGARSIVPANDAGPDSASTGIWVFDARTLDVVGRWKPAAMYDQVAVTPDGGSVVALGLAGSDADGHPADWGFPLAFHDAIDGRLQAVVGDTVGSDGYTPILLVPGGP